MLSLDLTPELTSCLVGLVMLLMAFLWIRPRNPRLPPCPITPLPLLGHVLALRKDRPALFRKWKAKCGDLFSLYVGSRLTVVVNGYDAIKEIFVRQADASSDRPVNSLMWGILDSYNKGILFSSGSNWKEQRSTLLTILREFGLGKDRLAQNIQEEIDWYIARVADRCIKHGDRLDIREVTYEAVSNVICSIITGHRFSYDDSTFKTLVKKLNENVAIVEAVGMLHVIRFLRYLPGDIIHAKKVQSNALLIMDLFVRKYLKSKGTDEYDENNIDNFIAAYVFERNKKTRAGHPTFLNDGNLERNILDMFAAGTETTSTTITWCLHYILHHPDVQEKIYQEIVREVGTERRPDMDDKSRLIYLNAVIKETQRLANIVPLSVPHFSSADITYKSYLIPRGTHLILNLDSVLQDKNMWGEDVEVFRPERFIDSTGKLLNPQEFIPFSIGRRVCLGEALAKMELFLFLSAIFQRFKFLAVDPASPPSLKPIVGMTSSPQPYEVKLVDRLDMTYFKSEIVTSV